LIRFLYEKMVDLYFHVIVRPKMIVLISRYNHHYKKLRSGRKKFERRVWNFIRENEFIPREEIKLTMALKVIIASHAVQLARYLPEEAYDYYERIIIYKDYYLSRFTQKYHKAEVNPSFKVIVFSVRAVHESINKTDDGVNVLLHEFAHALWLEHKLMGDQYEVFDPASFEAIELLMDKEFDDLQQKENHILRKYAFANKAEFFAVSVENFFERPRMMREGLPELYHGLVRLFHQDPYQG
jgi:MtfA peptidase